MFIYSFGLRVREVVNLKVKDIGEQRKLIHIENAKGRKNWYIIQKPIKWYRGRIS